MDGLGNKREPAWTQFVQYMNSAETGWTPGWMFYKSKFPSPSVGAPDMTAKVTSVIRRNLILETVLWVIGCVCCCGCCITGIYIYLTKQKKYDYSSESDNEGEDLE